MVNELTKTRQSCGPVAHNEAENGRQYQRDDRHVEFKQFIVFFVAKPAQQQRWMLQLQKPEQLTIHLYNWACLSPGWNEWEEQTGTPRAALAKYV